MPKIQLLLLFRIKGLLFFAVCLCILSSCSKPKTFPNEPYIEYRSLIYYSSISQAGDTIPLLQVCFYFQDGDGDIGCNTSTQKCPPDLSFSLERKVNDSLYEPVTGVDDTGGVFRIEYLYHLKPIEAVTSNGALYGTMTWTMDEFADIKREYAHQTLRFQIHLFDRSGNQSNRIYTQDIPL